MSQVTITIDAEDFPECAEGGAVNDDNPGRPICRTCDDDPNISALYPHD